MIRLVFALVVLAISPACTGDATAVVARVYASNSGATGGSIGNGDAGTPATDAGSDGVWPVPLTWSLYQETGGEAVWVTPPTASSVTVAARSPQNVRAGLAFQFVGDSAIDLAQFDQVEVTLDITEGDTFELFLGRGPNVGCSYVFSRGQSNKYTASLSSPAWCVPSQCSFDLKVTGGMVLAYVPTDSRLTATVTGLRFFSSSSGARSGSASALGGAKGPGGFCWFLVNWEKTANVGWLLTNPTSSSVHVRGTTTANSLVGMAFEIPQGFRLSQYRMLALDATVSNGTSQGTSAFLVQAVKLTQGRGWVLQGDGTRQPYRIDLTQPAYSFGSTNGSPLSLDDVTRIEFVPQVNGAAVTIDALVQGIEFQP